MRRARTPHGRGHSMREQVQLPADGQVVALRRADRHRRYARRAPHARASEARAHLMQSQSKLYCTLASEFSAVCPSITTSNKRTRRRNMQMSMPC